MLLEMYFSKFSRKVFSSILVGNLRTGEYWLDCYIPRLVVHIQNTIDNWLLVLSLRNWCWGTMLFDGTSVIYYRFTWQSLDSWLSLATITKPVLISTFGFGDWLPCHQGCRICLPGCLARWLAPLALQRYSCCSQTTVHLQKPCCCEQGVGLDEAQRPLPVYMFFYILWNVAVLQLALVTAVTVL